VSYFTHRFQLSLKQLVPEPKRNLPNTSPRSLENDCLLWSKKSWGIGEQATAIHAGTGGSNPPRSSGELGELPYCAAGRSDREAGKVVVYPAHPHIDERME
jgi:hypothetical protein